MSAIRFHDAALPGLHVAVDGPSMLGRLRGVLHQAQFRDVSVDGLRLERFRYRTGTRAIVLYAASTSDSNHNGMLHWASASLYRGDKAARIYAEYESRTSRQTAPGVLPGMLYDDDTEALWQFFPWDRHMPQIQQVLARGAGVRDALLAPTFGGVPVQARVARYRPGVGATLCFSDEASRRLFIKIYPRGRGATQFKRLSHLAHSVPNGATDFGLVTPTRMHDGFDALAIEDAPGRCLEEWLLDPNANVAEAARLSAGALAALHASSAASG